MNQGRKISIVFLFAVIMLFILLSFGLMLTEDVQQPSTTAEPVGDQMWDMRPLDLMLLSIMLFGGVLGVLALVGGEFKWS